MSKDSLGLQRLKSPHCRIPRAMTGLGEAMCCSQFQRLKSHGLEDADFKHPFATVYKWRTYGTQTKDADILLIKNTT